MFDPRFRYNADEIELQANDIIESAFFNELLQFIPVTFLIINEARQVVYVNKDLQDATVITRAQLSGLRPGECISCIRAMENQFGCGSSEYCKVCGFANAIGTSEKGEEKFQECVIALKDGESLTLNIRTKPFKYNEHDYVFCTIEDNSERKSRQMLESIFLHDIQNTSTILSGLQEVCNDIPLEQVRKILKDVSLRINEEINSYRVISSAESKTLVTKPNSIVIDELIEEIVIALKINPRFKKKVIKCNCNHQIIYSDKTLLRQVLINLVKNALEAGPDEDEIEISCLVETRTGITTISVKNKQVIAEEIQLQLFQKSFSTKGTGRGWGTYSIKLLTEKFLKGKVSFSSSQQQGTVFTIALPSLGILPRG